MQKRVYEFFAFNTKLYINKFNTLLKRNQTYTISNF